MTTTPKRIPNGTRVRWRARYPSDPVHEGEVLAFVDNGYPGGFRVLCFNCNFAVFHLGVCPHRKTS